MKRIVLLASLDTKPREAEYLRERIEEKGFEVVLVDVGYGGTPGADADISAGEVAEAAATSIDAVRENVDTGQASKLMMNGAVILLNGLIREGQCHGVISFGGASNTTLATGVMQTVPLGIPKVMISSTAAMPAYSARYFGSKDITMINAMVDFAGLNHLSRTFLDAGAAAVCGMAAASDGPVTPEVSDRQVAVTGFRFSEVCTQAVIRRLEELGYGVIPFHAQGIGENAFEDTVAQGLFIGVVDVVPAGLSEQLLGGNRAALPERLEAAGRLGIPQVVSTSGFDMISCGPISRRDSGDRLWESRKLAERKYSVPDRFRVEVRTTAEEVAEIATLVATKLNLATGPTKVMIPLRGWSSLSHEGAELHDPESDSAFVPALRRDLRDDVRVEELDLELNTDEFGIALANALHEMIGSMATAHPDSAPK